MFRYFTHKKYIYVFYHYNEYKIDNTKGIGY